MAEAEDEVVTGPIHVVLIMELTTGTTAGTMKTALIIGQNEEQAAAAEAVSHMVEPVEALEEATSNTMDEAIIVKITKVTKTIIVDRYNNHETSITQSRIKFQCRAALLDHLHYHHIHIQPEGLRQQAMQWICISSNLHKVHTAVHGALGCHPM